MVVQASIVGLFKTILIVIGAIVLLRFIGQLMIAKRNLAEERQLNEEMRKAEKERLHKLTNFGKTTIVSDTSKRTKHSQTPPSEDVDYEEVE